jgi:PIN domain nuclease of toxin-antitoxin system
MNPLPIYTLDTHAFNWHLYERRKLLSAARQAIDEGEAGAAILLISHVALAELFFLLTKVARRADFPAILAALHANLNYRMEPIVLDDIEKLAVVTNVPEMHDRLLVAATNRLGAVLITKDQLIQSSGQVQWLW